jgi:predicted DNA-binding transcriptional regulator AlpA
LERDGWFPKRIRLGANRVGWSHNEIMAWIAVKKADRSRK